MTPPSVRRASPWSRLGQAVALVAVLVAMIVATRLAPAPSGALGSITAVGLLLLAGTLTSELLETIGLPHLSGYLLAGALAGPHVLHLVDHSTVERLSPVNTLALALIALAGGLELRVSTLKAVGRSVAIGLLVQTGVGWVVLSGAFAAMSPLVSFASALPWTGLLAVSILWGTLAVSRSPSALLAVLAQTRAKGPLASHSLAHVMASDVVVLLLMACVIMGARPLISGGALSVTHLRVLGHEIVGSVAIGTTLGLLLVAYVKLVRRNLLLVLLALGLGMTEFMRYIQIEPLLSFLTAGFVVQNLSSQGDALLHAIERTSSVVFVVFFATAGAHLDLPLLGQLWPIALGLCAARAAVTVVTATWISRVVQDPPPVRRWGWAPLLSQAGLTLGLSAVIARAFPEFGEALRSLVVATVALNEVIGPILFKMALDRAGESQAG